MEVYSLDPTTLAAALFPKNRHPRHALNRILAGEALLDSDQLLRLSAICGVDIHDLFMAGNWRTTSTANNFTTYRGDYKAVLDFEKWTTTIYHKDSLLTEVVLHSKTIKLSDYINNLNEIILKLKKDD